MPIESGKARPAAARLARSSTACGALAVAIIVASCLLPQTSRATLLDLTVTGVATDVTMAVSGVFSLNDPMTVVYTYDSDAMPGPSLILTQAVYLGAISGASFSVGSYSGSAVGGNINIENDDPTFHDRIIFRGAGLNSASIGIHDPVEFTVLFEDASEMALSSLALPTVTSDLAGFGGGTWQLLFSPIPLMDDPTAAVTGRITSVTISPHPQGLPEPGALALFGLGLVGFGMVRRRRRTVRPSGRI